MINADHEDQTIQTYDMHAESWVVDHPQVDYSEILTRLKELKPHGTVIEIGCGGGQETFEQRSQSVRQENRIFVYWRKDDFEKVLQRNGFEVVYYGYDPKSERSKWHRFIVKNKKDRG